jgi:hypothetical protein
MNILEKARLQRKNILLSSESLDDKIASTTPELFGKLNENGELVKVGTRINWRGVLKRAAVDLWDTKENNPDNAPSLWEDILYKDGIRIIPETITVGTAFMKDELGWYEDTLLYKSLIDNNVWTPTAYPAGWELVEIAK